MFSLPWILKQKSSFVLRSIQGFRDPLHWQVKRLDTLAFKDVDEPQLAIARVVDQVADEMGVSSAQVALAWVRERGTIPIIGARTLAQLQDNLESLHLSLDMEHLAALEEASAINPGHPYDFLDKDMVRALSSGGMSDFIDNHHDCR